MSEDEPKPPAQSPRAVPSGREARLAQALRDNLRRRKAQTPAPAQSTAKPESDA
jgi:hypothetical protein